MTETVVLLVRAPGQPVRCVSPEWVAAPVGSRLAILPPEREDRPSGRALVTDPEPTAECEACFSFRVAWAATQVEDMTPLQDSEKELAEAHHALLAARDAELRELRAENERLTKERDTYRQSALFYEHRSGAHRGTRDRESSDCYECLSEFEAEEAALGRTEGK